MHTMKKWGLAAGLATAMLTTACGGGGGGNGGSGSPNENEGPQVPAKVEGPLDAVQKPLSDKVLGELSNAVAGTPLEGVILSLDQLLVQDFLDIVDVLAKGLRDAASSGDPTRIEGTAGDVKVQLKKMARDLRDLLAALGEGTGGGNGNDPLAGTPLAPLSAALLPLLDQIAGGGGGNDRDLQLTQLAALVAQINQQLQTGLDQVPAEARNAPVVGGVFVTLSVSLNDLTRLLQAAGAYNGNLTATRLETTVDNLLVNVLTKVVPLEFAEAQAGQPGVLTNQIKAGVAQLSALLGDNAGQVTTPVLEDLLGGALSPVLDPIENDVLPAVLTPIIDALGGTPTGGSGSGGAGFGGTDLGGVVTQVGDAVQDVLGPIIGGGTTPTCLFRNTPLQFLCSALGG